jgi:hypothetical protein
METRTRNAWLAAYLLAHGLRFVRAERLDAPLGVEFVLDDLRDQARALTRRFLDDTDLQAVIDARRSLARAIEIAGRRGVCRPVNLRDLLARIGRPWAER